MGEKKQKKQVFSNNHGRKIKVDTTIFHEVRLYFLYLEMNGN